MVMVATIVHDSTVAKATGNVLSADANESMATKVADEATTTTSEFLFLMHYSRGTSFR